MKKLTKREEILMSLKDNTMNETYLRIGLPEEKLNEVFERCVNSMKDGKNLSKVSFGTEIDVEINGMNSELKVVNVKKGINIFKYVAVAAFAVITSGAIIGGVAKYQSNKPAKAKVVATTTEKNDETTEQIPEEVTDPVINKEEFVDNSTYKKLFGNDGNDLELMNKRKMDVNGVKFKIVGKNNDDYLYVKGKDAKDFKEVVDLYCVSNIYTNGEYIYYLDGKEGEKICKYNIKDNKQEVTNIIDTIKATAPENTPVDSNQCFCQAFVVLNDIMYVSTQHIVYDNDEVTQVKYDIYTHNMISGETKLLKEDRAILETYNNYFITRRYMKPEEAESNLYETYIEVLNGDKLEECVSLGELSDFILKCNTVSNKYFYFEKFEKIDADIYSDKSVVKLLRVSKDDLGSEVKLEEVATLKSSDFNQSDDVDLELDTVSDLDCRVYLWTDDEENTYKYIYKTKKVEEIFEED